MKYIFFIAFIKLNNKYESNKSVKRAYLVNFIFFNYIICIMYTQKNSELHSLSPYTRIVYLLSFISLNSDIYMLSFPLVFFVCLFSMAFI